MVQNYTVWVEKKAYPVVVSDERKALLAAKAAGRAFVGLIHLEEYGGGSQKEERTEKSQTSELLRTENQPVEKAAEGKTANDIWDAEYLATPDAICPECAATLVCPGLSQKQTACSSGNLPWKILPGCQRSRMSGSHRKNGKPTRSFTMQKN